MLLLQDEILPELHQEWQLLVEALQQRTATTPMLEMNFTALSIEQVHAPLVCCEFFFMGIGVHLSF